MKYYIYKLTFKSGATYIGQHTEKFENDNYVSSSSYMAQHPEDPVIKRDILIEVKDKETLDIMETLCIRADKADNSKNVNKNFGNWDYRFCFKGFHHSDKTKTLLSNAHYKAGSDTAIIIGNKNKGRKNTEETKQLMSESAKKSWTAERKAEAVKSGNYSHRHTEETKKFLSDNQKGRVKINNGIVEKMIRNPEAYLNNGWSLGKLPVSDEARAHMSESAKMRKCNTVGKKKIHKGNVGKFVSLEELQKYLNDGWELGVTPEKRKLLQNIARKKN